MPITPLPPAPNRTDGHAVFVSRANAHVAALSLFTSEANALEENVSAKETSAVASASIATASANFKGSWSGLAGAAASPFSAHHDDNFWMLAEDVSDVTLFEPGVSDKWILIGLGIPIVANEAALGIGATDGQSAVTADTGHRWVWNATEEAWTDTDLLGIMPGSVIQWLTTTPPDGYLECNGAALSRVTYVDLFSVIGDAFGVGDGSTTFNIPDFRGEFLRGWDHGAGNDPDAATRTDRGDGTTGDIIGSKQGCELQAHNHFVNAKEATGVTAQNLGMQTTASDSLYTANTGGNETRPRNTTVMFCIKY